MMVAGTVVESDSDMMTKAQQQGKVKASTPWVTNIAAAIFLVCPEKGDFLNFVHCRKRMIFRRQTEVFLVANWSILGRYE